MTQDTVKKMGDEPKYLKGQRVLYPLGSIISDTADPPKS